MCIRDSFNSEELGMKQAAVWIAELAGEDIPVSWIAAGEPYRYL